MAIMPERPLDSAIIEDCNREYRDLLVRYAWAVLRDWSLASDAVQNSFVALARFGGDVAPDSRKSWLFKVVFREALRIRSIEHRHQQSLQDVGRVMEAKQTYNVTPLDQLVRSEELEKSGQQIEALPSEQKQVLKLRFFEDKTFAEIADQLQIPLGTALSRMRLALERLRTNDEHGK